MKLFHNPWFLAAAGLVVLAGYGWLASPLEMVAIGLPFYGVFVGTAMAVRYAKPVTPGAQKNTHWVVLPATGAVFGAGVLYIAWCAFTDRGIIGWLDAIQARRNGGFDQTLSFFVSFIYLMLITFAALALLTRLKANSAAPARPDAKPRRPMSLGDGRTMLFTAASTIAMIWVVGLGVYEYYTMRSRTEMGGSYTPVDVSRPVGASANLEFVSFRARVHRLGYVALRDEHESTGTNFIPLVTPANRDLGVPVHWVVAQQGGDLGHLPQPILAHALGEGLSQGAREALARQGVQLADDVELVSYVPTTDTGEVLNAAEDDWIYLIVGSGLPSVVLMMSFVIVWAKLRGPRRQTSAA